MTFLLQIEEQDPLKTGSALLGQFGKREFF